MLATKSIFTEELPSSLLYKNLYDASMPSINSTSFSNSMLVADFWPLRKSISNGLYILFSIVLVCSNTDTNSAANVSVAAPIKKGVS